MARHLKGQDTRQTIIRYLHRYPWSTTTTIGYGVGRTPHTVRNHLRELDAEGSLRYRPGSGGQHGNSVEYALVEDGKAAWEVE